MKTPTTSRIPLAIVGCVALALGSCGQKSASNDPAKERQLQDMQAKLDQLSAQSADLNHQLADRDAADAEAKRAQLKKDQADLDSQRAALESERNALASSQKMPVRTESTPPVDDTEPVYQGKPATYEVFYNKLQDDGDWIESADYGYIWQPRVARSGSRWRPYTDGRWVETDRGWTWESNERFGWATYHYGRWVNLADTGWCWVPGDQWAPAWVSWRSSDRYVGWAPLPPEAHIQRGGRITASVAVGYNTGPGFYNFVDTQDFGESTYVGRVIEPDRNVAIIDQTVNVTNITYSETNVYNYGPDAEVLRHRSRRPIEHYEVELNRDPRFDGNSARPQPRGDRLSIVAPLIAAMSQHSENSGIRPARVERKVANVDRNTGWRGVRPEQRDAIRADMQKQADSVAQTQQADRERQRAQKTRSDSRREQMPAAQIAATPVRTNTPAPARSQATATASPSHSTSSESNARREASQRREAKQTALIASTPAARTSTMPEKSATPEASAVPSEAPHHESRATPSITPEIVEPRTALDTTQQRKGPNATPAENPTPAGITFPLETGPNGTPAGPAQKALREAQRRQATQSAPDSEATPARPMPTPFPRPTAVDVQQTIHPQRQPQVLQSQPDTTRQQAAEAAREQLQQNAQAQAEALRERRQAQQQAVQQQAAPVERETTRTREVAPDGSIEKAPAVRRQQQPDAQQRERDRQPERTAQRPAKPTRGNPAEATESPAPQ